MKKRVGIIALLLAVVATLPLAAQLTAGMVAQKRVAQTSHQGTGKVVSMDRARLRIKLAHDQIDSLGWSAMEMDFRVANASLLDGLKAGDAVRFELQHLKADELVWGIAKIERK